MSDAAIARLTLRLSAVSPEGARALALSIARGVAAGSASVQPAQAPAVGVYAAASPGEGEDALAERIAREVLRALGGV